MPRRAAGVGVLAGPVTGLLSACSPGGDDGGASGGNDQFAGSLPPEQVCAGRIHTEENLRRSGWKTPWLARPVDAGHCAVRFSPDRGTNQIGREFILDEHRER
jgi:hypothetical protein